MTRRSYRWSTYGLAAANLPFAALNFALAAQNIGNASKWWLLYFNMPAGFISLAMFGWIIYDGRKFERDMEQRYGTFGD